MEVLKEENRENIGPKELKHTAISILSRENMTSFLMLATSKDKEGLGIHTALSMNGANLIKSLIHLFHLNPAVEEAAILAHSMLRDLGHDKAIDMVELADLKIKIDEKEGK